jgi:hypothetical protein
MNSNAYAMLTMVGDHARHAQLLRDARPRIDTQLHSANERMRNRLAKQRTKKDITSKYHTLPMTIRDHTSANTLLSLQKTHETLSQLLSVAHSLVDVQPNSIATAYKAMKTERRQRCTAADYEPAKLVREAAIHAQRRAGNGTRRATDFSVFVRLSTPLAHHIHPSLK